MEKSDKYWKSVRYYQFDLSADFFNIYPGKRLEISRGIGIKVEFGLKTFRLGAYHLPRIILGGIFIYSGIVKLADVKGFARMISQYDLVPEALLAPVAIGLPVVEFLAGLGLLFEIPGALSAIFGMLFMFCTVLWYGILQNLDIDCGCFSAAELKGQASLRQALYRDFVMIALCGHLFLYRFLRIKRAREMGGQEYPEK